MYLLGYSLIDRISAYNLTPHWHTSVYLRLNLFLKISNICNYALCSTVCKNAFFDTKYMKYCRCSVMSMNFFDPDHYFLDTIIRVRPSSSVSQSVGNLDISAKDKSAKPQRRLSIPTKSTFSPHQTSVGSITSISETRLNRSNVQGKSDTPLSESSKSASRRKFCVLSSVSYWLTQIKLSESAHKHSISLGFFKLALEAGCEVCI